MTLWNLILYAALGALIGWLAARIMGSKRGLLRNIVVGVVGSALGGWLAGLIGIRSQGLFTFVGMAVAIGGACLLIWLCRLVFGKR